MPATHVVRAVLRSKDFFSGLGRGVLGTPHRPLLSGRPDPRRRRGRWQFSGADRPTPSDLCPGTARSTEPGTKQDMRGSPASTTSAPLGQGAMPGSGATPGKWTGSPVPREGSGRHGAVSKPAACGEARQVLRRRLETRGDLAGRGRDSASQRVQRGSRHSPHSPGRSDSRLGCAAAGPPEGARPTKARLSHRRRRDRTGGRCPGRSPCFLHPVWHWHPLQHLGPAGQPRAPALGGGKERGSHRAAPPGEEPRALAGRAQSGAFQTHRRAAPEALAWTMLGQLLSGRLPRLDGPRPTSSHHSHRLTPGP